MTGTGQFHLPRQELGRPPARALPSQGLEKTKSVVIGRQQKKEKKEEKNKEK
jgi:hypothetical protein